MRAAPPHLDNSGGQGLEVLYAHVPGQDGGQLGYLLRCAAVGPLEEHDAGFDEAALLARQLLRKPRVSRGVRAPSDRAREGCALGRTSKLAFCSASSRRVVVCLRRNSPRPPFLPWVWRRLEVRRRNRASGEPVDEWLGLPEPIPVAASFSCRVGGERRVNGTGQPAAPGRSAYVEGVHCSHVHFHCGVRRLERSRRGVRVEDPPASVPGLSAAPTPPPRAAPLDAP